MKSIIITLIVLGLICAYGMAVASDKTDVVTATDNDSVNVKLVAAAQLERLRAEYKQLFDQYMATESGQQRQALTDQYNLDAVALKEKFEADLEALVNKSSDADKKLLQELLSINNAIQFWRNAK